MEHQRKDWSNHKRSCYKLGDELYKDDNKMIHEALEINLFEEYKALETRYMKGEIRPYDEARYFIYKGIVSVILRDPVKGDIKEDDERWELIRADIKKGHELMMKTEPDVMWDGDDLMWAFIPKNLWRYIEYICDGCTRFRPDRQMTFVNDLGQETIYHIPSHVSEASVFKKFYK
jgi:hypothetical protein